MLLKDLWLFLKQRKKWWLAPIIILLLMITIIMILGTATPLGPYIYSLF